MSVLPVGFGGDGGGAAPSYEIEKSLRFRASASAFLSRTPGGAGNRRTWTWSGWVKRGALGTQQQLLTVGATTNDITTIAFTPSDQLDALNNIGGTTVGRRQSTAVFRDPSAHLHIVVVWNTPNATAADRCQLWVNGVRLTSFAISTDPTLNQDAQVSTTLQHFIGRTSVSSTLHFDGYLSEINFIDGQALDPNSFGETDPVTGVWVPKAYTGTYGTNGFYLPFSNGTSLSTLTADASGNGNNWTANNISLTAGATYDWMDDTPTNNFAVLNPLDTALTPATLTNANLTHVGGAGNRWSRASIAAPNTGKWYVELTLQGTGDAAFTLSTTAFFPLFNYSASSGNIIVNNASVGNFATSSSGDVLSLAFDRDANTCVLRKNNSVVYTATGLNAGAGVFQVFTGVAITHSINFGQRPFAYTPPTGFLPLCTKNLPAPTIQKPSDHFDVVLATGANIKTSTEALYTHQLAWIKDRANSNNHQLIDSVRGTSAVLQSNTTAAETTYTAPSGTSVGWVWNAPNTGVTNTDGSITSTVSANTTAGFSIVTYTGTSANATVGHGLGVAPGLVIVKRRDTTGNWPARHSTLAAANTLYLNTTAASASAATVWNSTAPTSSVFSIGTSTDTNASGGTYVAYCFTEVPGFSRIGSYVGTGSLDSVFVWCGFRPRFLMVKNASAAADWVILDSAREPVNDGAQAVMFPSSISQEAGAIGFDFLANGFKNRSGGSSALDASGQTYIFIAFAESPFNFSRAR